MPLTFDAASEEDGTGTTSPFSWNHTIGIGKDRLLIVAFFISTGVPETVSSVTYGGSTMTKHTNLASPGDAVELFIYYITAPPVGTGAISIITSAGHHLGGMAVSYFGADQNNPIDEGNSARVGTGGSTISANVRGQVGQILVSAMTVDNRNTETNPPNPTSGSGITERIDEWTHSGTTTQTAAGVMGDQLKIAETSSVSYDKPTGEAVLIAFSVRDAVPARSRLVRYMHNTFMSRLAGRPIILDVQGRDMPLPQVEFDQWIRTDGPFFPTPRQFASTIEDPAVTYIESLHIQGERATIETNKDLFLESILDTLGGSS